MELFNHLPIKETEVSEDQKHIEVTLAYQSPMGRCCLSFSSSKPLSPPIIFKIPLDNSVMFFNQWITRNNLEVPFYGVDRTLDPTRLAGVYEAINSNTLLMDGAALLNREGAAPNIVIIEKNIGYFIQLNTWSWIIQRGKRVALVCDMPGFNGIIKRGNK